MYLYNENNKKHNINNKNDNPKEFILFSVYYLGNQIRQSALCKIFQFLTNSSSVDDEFLILY